MIGWRCADCIRRDKLRRRITLAANPQARETAFKARDQGGSAIFKLSSSGEDEFAGV